VGCNRVGSMRPLHLCLLLSLPLAACGVDTDARSQLDDVEHPDDGECGCKVEGAYIGQPGFLVRVGSDEFIIEDWVPKSDSPGEYIGFFLSEGAEGHDFVVKAGIDRFAGSGTEWMHPHGDSPDAHAISNIDFCEGDGDGGGDGDGDGSGGGSNDNDEDGDGLPDVD